LCTFARFECDRAASPAVEIEVLDVLDIQREAVAAEERGVERIAIPM